MTDPPDNLPDNLPDVPDDDDLRVQIAALTLRVRNAELRASDAEAALTTLRADLPRRLDAARDAGAAELEDAIDRASEALSSWHDTYQDLQVAAEEAQEAVDRQKLAGAERAGLLRRLERFERTADEAAGQPRQPRGRVLAASPKQAQEVRILRAKGQSLAAIASETGLGIRTVRTVLSKAALHAEAVRREKAKARQAAHRQRQIDFRRILAADKLRLAEAKADAAHVQSLVALEKIRSTSPPESRSSL